MTYVIDERISSLSEYRSSKQRLVSVERQRNKYWVRIASRSNTTRLDRLAADEVTVSPCFHWAQACTFITRRLGRPAPRSACGGSEVSVI